MREKTIDLSGNLEQQQVERCSSFPDEFPIVDHTMSYLDFFSKHLIPNVPCLIRAEGVIKGWGSRRSWVRDDGRIDLEALGSILPAKVLVPVSHCGKKYFNAQESCEKSFDEFREYWDKRKDAAADHEPCLYLKDWHFRRDCPDFLAYDTPSYFASDWLNEYWDKNKDSDYRFVYIGPKNSWTPFHSDVFGSYSWSANVVGKKHWIFFPPGQEVRDEAGRLVYDAEEEETAKGSSMTSSERKRYDVIQESGDVIFVPSLWHHQVRNLEDTLSVNHNWFNGTNVDLVFQVLRGALADVEREIEDCKVGAAEADEWGGMCQDLLRANHGMNFEDFLDILECVARTRVEVVNGESTFQFDGVALGRRHAMFDLARIEKLLVDNRKDLDEKCRGGASRILELCRKRERPL